MNFEQFIQLMVDHSPALVVAVPLLGAFLTPLVSFINDKVRNVFVLILLLFNSFIVFLLSHDVFTNGIHTYVFGAKNPSSPVVRILFEVDGISAFMAIIVTIIASVAVLYSWGFMEKQTGLDKYYTLMLLMTAGMLGMVLTGDMFNFFVFLEITSISSCALIAFWTNKGKSIDAALKYIIVSTVGALCFLFAVGIMYGQYNALNIAVLADSITFGFLDKMALVLIFAALAMKAGLVPMHMWLPDAYGRAPSSVSVMLVVATQASLYGVFRMIFTLYGSQLSEIIGKISIDLSQVLYGLIVLLALFTIIIGVLMAVKQNDLKRMIAFAALAEIGYMFLAVGASLSNIGTTAGITVLTQTGEKALQGGLFHIFNDALDIGLLFLIAGAIYYTTRETSLNKLGGLARNMKYTTVFFIIGLLAVSGMPPMNGFASKLLIYESVYAINPILAIAAILGSILLLATFVKVFHSIFLGPKIPSLEKTKEAPKSMLAAMAVVAGIIIFFGLFPEVVLNNIIEPAADALINHGEYLSWITSGGGV
ncbi:MAG: proton-conducting transporter membrane subunit [Candidatus Thermoplasmatota archaeon]